MLYQKPSLRISEAGTSSTDLKLTILGGRKQMGTHNWSFHGHQTDHRAGHEAALGGSSGEGPLCPPALDLPLSNTHPQPGPVSSKQCSRPSSELQGSETVLLLTLHGPQGKHLLASILNLTNSFSFYLEEGGTGRVRAQLLFHAPNAHNS